MQPRLRNRCAIAVMAKAPRPGYVKTRLCPPLRPEQATALSAAFLRDITENLREAGRAAPIDGVVAYAPAGHENGFDGMLAEGTKLILADGAIADEPGVSGFGRCLLHAMQALFGAGYGAVCVLNADSPTLPTLLLVRAASLLLAPGERAVLGAAEDGGYYLLGLQAPHAHPFADIAWSTETVAATTRARIGESGLDLVELDSWYDVDDAVSLRRLVDGLASPPTAKLAPYAAPATAEALTRLGLRGCVAAK